MRLSHCSLVPCSSDHFFREVESANFATLRATAQSLKCTTAGFFRCFKEAIALYEEIDGETMDPTYGRLPLLQCASYSHFELYRVSGKRGHLAKARRYKKLLEKLASNGSSDAATFSVYVSAVELTAKKKVDKEQLLKSVENAISKVVKKGNYVVEGMLNEHAGFDFARRGHLAEARKCSSSCNLPKHVVLQC